MPKTDENKDDYILNSFPVCPHCDYVPVDMAYFGDLFDDRKVHDVDCPSCSKTYYVSTYVDVSFSTSYEEF